jgi:hypothetical protein
MSPIPMNDGTTEPQTDADALLSPEMMRAIHGDVEDKKAEYEASLKRWWTEYADRKNDEEDEYVANSLLYDRNHLPRTAPAPECCQEARQGEKSEVGESQ